MVSVTSHYGELELDYTTLRNRNSIDELFIEVPGDFFSEIYIWCVTSTYLRKLK
jgi:hypothetical protein